MFLTLTVLSKERITIAQEAAVMVIGITSWLGIGFRECLWVGGQFSLEFVDVRFSSATRDPRKSSRPGFAVTGSPLRHLGVAPRYSVRIRTSVRCTHLSCLLGNSGNEL